MDITTKIKNLFGAENVEGGFTDEQYEFTISLKGLPESIASQYPRKIEYGDKNISPTEVIYGSDVYATLNREADFFITMDENNSDDWDYGFDGSPIFLDDEEADWDDLEVVYLRDDILELIKKSI